MKRHATCAVLAAAVLTGCAQQRDIVDPGVDRGGLATTLGAGHLSCPSSTPAPGSRVDGGLEVNGICILDGVTVNGGITVDAGGHLQVEQSTINDGILVLPCGEIDVNATTNGAGIPTGTTATINGGIAITAASNCASGALSDADIWTARISGGLSVTGTYENGLPTVCGNAITGDVTIDNLTSVVHTGATIGNPDTGCPGNTVHGAVSASNSQFFEVEGNRISGSVVLSASILEVNGNVIGGSLLCSNGTVIIPGFDPLDPSGNTVRGANKC